MSYFLIKNNEWKIKKTKRNFRKSTIDKCFIITHEDSLIKIQDPCDISNNKLFLIGKRIKIKIEATLSAISFIWK